MQVNLRQLDMKLLCQLWALNESLQDYKKTLEDEENQREVASILEAHLEDEEGEETEEDLEANSETSWTTQNKVNTNLRSKPGTHYILHYSAMLAASVEILIHIFSIQKFLSLSQNS